MFSLSLSALKVSSLLISAILITGAHLQAQAAPVLTSVTVNPSTIPSGGTAVVKVSVSEACPSTGCSVGLYSQSSLFPVPPSMIIPAGSTNASISVVAGNTSASISFQVSANMDGVYKSTWPWIDRKIIGAYLISMTSNQGGYVHSGKNFTMTITVSEPCPSEGCVVSVYSNYRSLINLPSTYTIPAGQTVGVVSVVAGSTTYPVPASVSATLNGVSKYSYFNIFAALGEPATDGSYAMIGFGNSTRSGTGSVTKTMNISMAKNNMTYNVTSLVTKQCLAAIPGGVLVNVGSPIGYGEFRNANGYLQYNYTQNLNCRYP